MKTAEQLKPNYAPVYAAATYPMLAAIFQRNGYALAVHGSLARDFDLIAVPWNEAPSDIEDVLKAITKETAMRIIGDYEVKPKGRLAYTLSVGFGECAVDLSFIGVDEPCIHDWKWIEDWGGDAGVIGGTFDCSRWTCANCGKEDTERERPASE